MPQTYHQLKSQIAALQAQAEGVKRAEVDSVIAKAKDAIQVYGLTRQDLFGTKVARTAKAVKSPRRKKAKSTEPKYTDGKGGFWVGRGKRPQWLNDLLGAGARIEDFLVSKFSTAAPAAAVPEPATAPAVPATADTPSAPKKRAPRKAAARKTAAKGAAKKAAGAKYQDGAGHSWGGFGPRPGWLKEAIAGGKKLEDFLS